MKKFKKFSFLLLVFPLQGNSAPDVQPDPFEKLHLNDRVINIEDKNSIKNLEPGPKALRHSVQINKKDEKKTEIKSEKKPIEELDITDIGNVDPQPKKKHDEPIKLGGRIQYDVRRHQQTDPTQEDPVSPSTAFSLRRVRLDAKGSLAPAIKYKTSIEMADKVKAKDLYIKIKQNKHLVYEGGQFSYPLGSENISSSRYYEFLEPSMLSNTFSGSRDRGVLVIGDALEDRLFFSAGMVNGTGDTTPDRNANMDYVAQAQGLVYENASYDIKFWLGSSFETGRRDSSKKESVEVAPESESGFTLFSADLPNDQVYTRQRYDIDAKLLIGPVMLMGEILNGDFTYENTANVKGGYVFASYFLTGEQRTVEDGLLEKQKIKNPIDTTDGWGAWEIAIRYSWFQVSDNFFLKDGLFASWEAIDPATNARKGNALTLGINWFPTSNTRVMLNYVKTTSYMFDETAAAFVELFAENALLIRGQIEF